MENFGVSVSNALMHLYHYAFMIYGHLFLVADHNLYIKINITWYTLLTAKPHPAMLNLSKANSSSKGNKNNDIWSEINKILSRFTTEERKTIETFLLNKYGATLTHILEVYILVSRGMDRKDAIQIEATEKY